MRRSASSGTLNSMAQAQYFITYKPFGVQSQFRTDNPEESLKTIFDFPKRVYPVGRLDKDSEGLLILTDDETLNKRLLDPDHGHIRKYLVQVEGEVTRDQMHKLATGVDIRINKKDYRTKPCTVRQIEAPRLPERNPPIRYRKDIPTSWLELELTEGKNRQVRRMTAAVGLPTLRLVRWSIERLDARGMDVGDVAILEKKEIYHFLFNQRV